jgi:lysozyme family protein
VIAPDVIERNIDRIINVREKGFSNNAADKGGPTNWGITAVTLGKWRKLGRPATVDEVRGLQKNEAREIYRHDYIEQPGFLVIEDAILFDAVVDVGVNCAPWRAVAFLQRALHLVDDGKLGPITRAAIRKAQLTQLELEQLYRDFVAERLLYYARIVSGDRTDADRDGIPDNMEFAAGWMNRTAEFIRLSPRGAS